MAEPVTPEKKTDKGRVSAPPNGVRVLIIEDEPALVDALTYNLRREGYEVSSAANGENGLLLALHTIPDIILLDIMLPGINGQEILRELRATEKTRAVPVIILSARSEEIDQVVGFSLGADDYVTKPFSFKVLLQRIKALHRRSDLPADTAAEVVHHGPVRLDLVRHKAFVSGNEMILTPTEFRLLECLVTKPGRAFSRLDLMENAIGEGAIVLERTIDVHVKTLRKKLGDMDLIETVRGVGYRFKE
ncbi:MAG: response regulator transcription factor [Gemmataceae bacterium]|nr:response regulator transcription factor [Gemmataceae bacterium]